jgi:4,5-DOPA dioxygenase extradiol
MASPRGDGPAAARGSRHLRALVHQRDRGDRHGHIELGARLAPLRRHGVLIVASGNVVHNLRRVRPAMAEAGFDWAQRFDEDARAVMVDDPTEVAALTGHADFATAAPTPDHFVPLLYLAGLAGDASRSADVLVDGYAAGSLSMTSYTLDAACPPLLAGGGGAAALPAHLDPDDINVCPPERP